MDPVVPEIRVPHPQRQGTYSSRFYHPASRSLPRRRELVAWVEVSDSIR